MSKLKINTIYIISKGRPHCDTARTLTEMNYTGEWFIVCGNNDTTIDEYKKNWGESRILVFDWYEEVKQSDLLDNFGYEKKSSGAVPVRNATMKISKERGELRHWQFDDDYSGFAIINKEVLKWHRLTGAEFEKELYKLAAYAHKAKLANIGFGVPSDTWPQIVKQVGGRVFNAHNLPNNSSFVRWRSRLNDDLINAIDVFTFGKRELWVKYMHLLMKPTQSEKGGNTDLYLADGTVRKSAYSILVNPNNVKLTIRHQRFHHKVDWRGIVPKLIHERFK